MVSDPTNPMLGPFLATAESVASTRPDVELDMAREVFVEAATLLHNGLALDGLDAHDTDAVVAGLCTDLCDRDPGVAIRARAQAISTDPGGLHDPQGAVVAYRVAVQILQL